MRKWIVVIFLSAFVLSGCSVDGNIQKETETKEETVPEVEASDTEISSASTQIPAQISVETAASEGTEIEMTEPELSESAVPEPEMIETDWSEYFGGLNGAAVIYYMENGSRQYSIYNEELALTRTSPCSTFKIISSLIALEGGILVSEDSTYEWSGEVFWNADWNQDIDFEQAFRSSCVWYFRKVVDQIGQKKMQEELDRLSYGNLDISDWEGRLNTNNGNPALTGFWIESSLQISPKEQTEVMARIFGENSVCSEETREQLKKVMLVTEENKTDLLLYGKTGTGMKDGIVVDAWFTGFAEKEGKKFYFCIYLGRTDGENVSGAVAKEIAIQIVTEFAESLCDCSVFLGRQCCC